VRVLLINPFYPISETPSPPLGLAFLAGALERAGNDVRILDCVVFPYSHESLASLIREFKPHMAGATAVTMTVDNALEVLDQVKALDPSVTTVIGGPHATFRATEILQSCDQVDVVACGEGEATIVALAKALEDRSPWKRCRASPSVTAVTSRRQPCHRWRIWTNWHPRPATWSHWDAIGPWVCRSA
jgi:anaerobic magnesium-protoporphyrin IX monomethyl ester cyclase